jgi:hypothetical protein
LDPPISVLGSEKSLRSSPRNFWGALWELPAASVLYFWSSSRRLEALFVCSVFQTPPELKNVMFGAVSGRFSGILGSEHVILSSPNVILTSQDEILGSHNRGILRNQESKRAREQESKRAREQDSQRARELESLRARE